MRKGIASLWARAALAARTRHGYRTAAAISIAMSNYADNRAKGATAARVNVSPKTEYKVQSPTAADPSPVAYSEEWLKQARYNMIAGLSCHGLAAARPAEAPPTMQPEEDRNLALVSRSAVCIRRISQAESKAKRAKTTAPSVWVRKRATVDEPKLQPSQRVTPRSADINMAAHAAKRKANTDGMRIAPSLKRHLPDRFESTKCLS